MSSLQRTLLPILRLTTAAVEHTPCIMANVFTLTSASRMLSSSAGVSMTGLRASQAFRLTTMPPLARVPAALRSVRGNGRFSTMLQAAGNHRDMSAHAAAVSSSETSSTAMCKTCGRFRRIEFNVSPFSSTCTRPVSMLWLFKVGVLQPSGHGGKVVGGRMIAFATNVLPTFH